MFLKLIQIIKYRHLNPQLINHIGTFILLDAMRPYVVETKFPQLWGKHKTVFQNKRLIPNWDDQWHEREREVSDAWVNECSMVMISFIMCRNTAKKKKCTKIIISSYYTKEIKHQWQCIRQMIFQEHTHTHTRKRIIKRYKLHIAHSSLMTFSNVRKLCKITKKINLLIPSLIVWIYCILLSCYDGSGTSKSKIRSMLTHGGYLSHIVPKLTKKHLLTSSVALESNH